MFGIKSLKNSVHSDELSIDDGGGDVVDRRTTNAPQGDIPR